MGCQDFSHRRFQLSHVRLLHLETHRSREGENPAKFICKHTADSGNVQMKEEEKREKKKKEWENFKGCQASTN
jgi:hypothetical protein